MNKEERQKAMAEDKEYQEYKQYKMKKEERLKRQSKYTEAYRTKDDKYKKYAFWTGVGAVVLSIINLIWCFKTGRDTWDTQLNGKMSLNDLVNYCVGNYSLTVLFKISAITAIAAIVLLLVCYLINEQGPKKIIMIICRGIESVCLLIAGAIFLLNPRWPIFTLIFEAALIGLAITELVAFILYMIDGFYRKTGLWIALFTVWTFLHIFLAIIVLSIGGVLLMLYILKCILFPCTPEKHLIDTETGHEIVEKWY